MDRKKLRYLTLILGIGKCHWMARHSYKQAVQGASASTTTSTYNKFIPYTVQALNDEVVPVYIQKVVEYGMVQMKNWRRRWSGLDKT